METILVKYSEGFGVGSLEGLFITTQDKLKSLNGVMIDFGEVLGKHSEVITDETYDYCKVMDVSVEDMEALVRVFGTGTISGYNPLEYLNPDDCEWCYGEGDE